MTVVPTIICRAGDLSAVLAESVRVVVHAQLEEVIARSQRCPYVLTPEGDAAAQRYDREILDLIK